METTLTLSMLNNSRGVAGPKAAASMSASAAAALLAPSSQLREIDGEEREDEGPFFDLDFTVSDSHVARSGAGGGVENVQFVDGEDDKYYNFSMSSEESGDLRSMPPSDNIFVNGRLFPLEESSIVITGEESDPKNHPALSLLKSATRFRIFILGLRKLKSPAVEPVTAGALPKQSQLPSKLFFVKFKVEEAPIVSLFTRDGSLRSLVGGAKDLPKDTDAEGSEDSTIVAPASEEKRPNSKDVVQKYLSKIKPFYVRVSKRYADKLKFSGPLVHDGIRATEMSPGEESEGHAEEQMGAKVAEKTHKLPMPARLRLVYERLGKSRSAPLAVAAITTSPQRRDDSLLQQQDGIQSAIAHCKRSFTATSNKDAGSPLLRSNSDRRASCV